VSVAASFCSDSGRRCRSGHLVLSLNGHPWCFLQQELRVFWEKLEEFTDVATGVDYTLTTKKLRLIGEQDVETEDEGGNVGESDDEMDNGDNECNFEIGRTHTQYVRLETAMAGFINFTT
jgi:hypothetical protein